MKRMGVAISFVALLLLVATAKGEEKEDIAKVSGGNIVVVVGDGKVEVITGFFVQASSWTVWEVITDFDALPSFIPMVKKSRIISKNPLVVRQILSVKVRGINRTVPVECQFNRKSESSMQFQGVGGDLHGLSGFWSVSEKDGMTIVHYQIRFKISWLVELILDEDEVTTAYLKQTKALINEISRREERRRTLVSLERE